MVGSAILSSTLICDNGSMDINTTYFLGAGASKALYPSLPLASELTLEFLLNRRGLPVGFDEAIEQVERYISTQRWPRRKRSIPFEQIYSDFPANLPPFWPRENLEICLFRKLRIEGTGAVPHSWLKANAYAGNPILTTNYDTVIEWDVENLSIAPVGFGDSGIVDYGIPDELFEPLRSGGPRMDGRPERLLLLKLYGSLGWSQCESCGKYCLERIYEAEGANAIMGRGKCGACNATQRNAVFVPLVGDKKPTNLGLRAIWDRAEHVLSESSQIVFAGFSLDPNDRSIGGLLRRACSSGQPQKVTVVQRALNPAILERYKSIYGDRVVPYDSGWAQYLREFSREENRRLVQNKV